MKNKIVALLPFAAALLVLLIGMAATRRTVVGQRLNNTMMDMGKSVGVSEIAVGKAMPSSIMPPTPYYDGNGDDLNNPIRSIVRNAYINAKVKDVSNEVKETTNYIKSVGGLILESSINQYEKNVIGSLSVRVPEGKLDEVVAWISGRVSRVISMNVSSSDQTGELTNSQNRLVSLNSQRAEYEELLKNTTTNSGKISVQTKLDAINRQISNLENQINNKVENEQMSSMQISYEKESFSIPFLDSLNASYEITQAVSSLVGLLKMLIVLLIWVVVFVPFWLPTLIIVKKLTGENSKK